MFTLYVVDRSAESRTKLVGRINAYLKAEFQVSVNLPQIGIKPLALEELKFHAAPDACLIGPEIATGEFSDLGRIRKLLSNSILLAWLNDYQDLSVIERLAAVGIDDTLAGDISASEFIRKLVLMTGRRRKNQKSGRLVVVASGKGGVGTTSVAAAISEGLAAEGHSTLVIDFDSETQDLSRFLQVRPFINENLQNLFDRTKPVTQENVQECLSTVWSDEANLMCMTPIPESDTLFDPRSGYQRTLLSIFEMLDGMFDFVVVDAADLRSSALRVVLRIADELIFVINNDPASLYAGVDRLNQFRSLLAADAVLTVVENAAEKTGLSHNFLQKEFSNAAQLTEGQTFMEIPLCNNGSRWPASGGTLYSRSASKTVKAIREVVDRIIPADMKQEKSGLMPAFQTLMRRVNVKDMYSELKNNNAQAKIAAPERKALPLPTVVENESSSADSEAELGALISGAHVVSD